MEFETGPHSVVTKTMSEEEIVSKAVSVIPEYHCIKDFIRSWPGRYKLNFMNFSGLGSRGECRILHVLKYI